MSSISDEVTLDEDGLEILRQVFMRKGEDTGVWRRRPGKEETEVGVT